MVGTAKPTAAASTDRARRREIASDPIVSFMDNSLDFPSMSHPTGTHHAARIIREQLYKGASGHPLG